MSSLAQCNGADIMPSPFSCRRSFPSSHATAPSLLLLLLLLLLSLLEAPFASEDTIVVVSADGGTRKEITNPDVKPQNLLLMSIP